MIPKQSSRHLSFIVVFAFALIVLMGVQPSLAAEFEAQIVVYQEGATVNGYVFVSGDKVRVDMTGPRGKIITIARPDKGLTWIVNVPKKEYVEIQGVVINPLGMRPAQEWEKVAKVKSLGQDKFGGFVCERILYTFFDESKGAVMEWKALDLNFTIKSILYSPKELVTTELSEIKVEPVDDVAFEMPEGYKKVMVKKSTGQGVKDGKQ